MSNFYKEIEDYINENNIKKDILDNQIDNRYSYITNKNTKIFDNVQKENIEKYNTFFVSNYLYFNYKKNIKI